MLSEKEICEVFLYLRLDQHDPPPFLFFFSPYNLPPNLPQVNKPIEVVLWWSSSVCVYVCLLVSIMDENVVNNIFSYHVKHHILQPANYHLFKSPKKWRDRDYRLAGLFE